MASFGKNKTLFLKGKHFMLLMDVTCHDTHCTQTGTRICFALLK